MNQHAVQHIMDSAYCFPISKKEITLRLRTAKDDVAQVWVMYESKYVIGETQKKASMEKKLSGALYDYYSVTLSLEDTRLAYVFYLYDGKEYYFFSEDGVTKTYDFSVGYYNFFQYPYINEADILKKVEWTEQAVFYQIFVDRFCMGNDNIDKSYINCSWGDIPTPKTFAGGDLKGIVKKLDYIRELGINTIYLTPVFQSKSNHKYDISDYYTVDKQFGTNEDLEELVQTAHQKGLRIVLDAVFNHCSEELEQFQDVVRYGKASPFYDWFVVDGEKPDTEKGNYEMFAACKYMPKFNTSNTETQEFLIDIACHYIKQYDIDGWRLDVSDEVSHDFWRKFRKRVKACKEDCVIIGENWHDASQYLRGDQYDSIMNYAFTKACLDFFAKETINAAQLAARFGDILARNTDTVNSMMLNLLDSHDTHRFFSEVGHNVEKMTSALHLLFLFPGMPCVFYGTELLTEGGYDPDCRRCMDWNGISKGKYQATIQLIQKLALLRKKYPLSSAETKLDTKDDVFIVKRICEGTELILYINHSGQEKEMDGMLLKAYGHSLVVKGRE